MFALRASLVVGMLLGFASPSCGFDAVVVIGDSLSDTGNAGRYSDGPVWVEHLADRLGLTVRPSEAGGTNFAVGGARLDAESGPSSLRAQADRYLKSATPARNALFIVYGGGNDVLGNVGASDAHSAVARAAASLQSIIADLERHGAGTILIPNLPDVGITPAVRAGGSNALKQAFALSRDFNAAVDSSLAGFAASPALKIHRLDVHTLAENVKADPAAFGFSDISTSCSGTKSCEGYLFWDGIHPTSRAHARLAEAAFELIAATVATP